MLNKDPGAGNKNIFNQKNQHQMAIQKHSIDFPKRLIHYRGGSYPFRRVSGHWKEEPDRKVNSLVSSEQMFKKIWNDIMIATRVVLIEKINNFNFE